MSTDQSVRIPRPSNELRFDDHGRVIHLTAEERKAWSKAAAANLKAMEAIPDTDPPGSEIDFLRAIDAERPGRPLFEK